MSLQLVVPGGLLSSRVRFRSTNRDFQRRTIMIPVGTASRGWRNFRIFPVARFSTMELIMILNRVTTAQGLYQSSQDWRLFRRRVVALQP